MSKAPLPKDDRQRLIMGLLGELDLHSQTEVCDTLLRRGIEVTQATVSRDLEELGAVKVRGSDGELVYRLGPDPGPASARARLEETLRRFLRRVDVSGNLIVLRTPPACASPVASIIDLAELPGVLASVAGDDTVIVVAAEGVPATELADRFRQLAALPG